MKIAWLKLHMYTSTKKLIDIKLIVFQNASHCILEMILRSVRILGYSIGIINKIVVSLLFCVCQLMLLVAD